jgi:hypothetical protein
MSFLKVRKKPKKDLSFVNLSASAPPSATRLRAPSPMDDSVFAPGNGTTRKINLNQSRMTRLTPGVTPSETTPVPSRFSSLTRVAPPVEKPYAPQLDSTAEEAPPTVPLKLKNGIGGTLSSQPPLRNVFDDKSDKSRRASVDSGFFARVVSLTKGKRGRKTSDAEQQFGFDTRSFNEDNTSDNQRRVEEMRGVENGHQNEPSRDDAVSFRRTASLYMTDSLGSGSIS